jgi:hypothetical protein
LFISFGWDHQITFRKSLNRCFLVV